MAIEPGQRLIHYRLTALAVRFTRADDSPLTPEQLEALRSLGYIQ